MGIVLQPYFLSPSISSISFIASRIREITKAKPVYSKVILVILMVFTAAGLKKKRISHQLTTRTVQAVKAEIMILPDKSFFFSEIEYTNKSNTQAALESPSSVTCVVKSR